MLGAVAGDIIGSTYEYKHQKRYEFELIPRYSRFTDDSVMTLAVAKWFMDDKSLSTKYLIECMQKLGRRYPCDYGCMFMNWLSHDNPNPNNSFGNGSAMRVSPVGLYASSLNEAMELAYLTASVSHNHPEGVKGAQSVAATMYMARNGYTKEQIREVIAAMFDYNLFRTIKDIRPTYRGGGSCQRSVPEAIIAFLDGNDFEDVVRLAVSLGGDADTQAAIAGGIAACIYPIPANIVEECERRLTPELLQIMRDFEIFIEERNQVKIENI